MGISAPVYGDQAVRRGKMLPVAHRFVTLLGLCVGAFKGPTHNQRSDDVRRCAERCVWNASVVLAYIKPHRGLRTAR